MSAASMLVIHATPRRLSFERLVKRIAARHGTTAATAWTKAVLGYQAQINEAALRSAIASGDLNRIHAVLEASKLQQVISRAMQDPLAATMTTAGRGSAEMLSKAGVAATFNAAHPNVALFARQAAGDLVVNIPAETRKVIAEVIALGAERGLTVVEQARAIREVVGLPPNWVSAPFSLEDDLRNGREASATTRRLSAATKQQIRNRMRNGTITEKFIRSVTEEYSKSLINLRALTIARTETIRAAHAGLQESWTQARQQGNLPASARKFWIVTPDHRLSPEHSRIPGMNPAGRKLDEPFVTSEGLHMHPPSRPNCRCSVSLAFTGGRRIIDAPSTLDGGRRLRAEASRPAPGETWIAPGRSAPGQQPPAKLLAAYTDEDGYTVRLYGGISDRAIREEMSIFGVTRLDPDYRRRGYMTIQPPKGKELRKSYWMGAPEQSWKIKSARWKKMSWEERAAREVQAQALEYSTLAEQYADLAGEHIIPSWAIKAPARTLRSGGAGTAALEEIQDTVRQVLAEMGVAEDVVKYSTKLGNITVGGRKGRILGEFSGQNIYLNPRQTVAQMRQTVAHEAQHFKFDAAMRADRALLRDIKRDYDGLRRDDGVTAYSRDHWNQSALTEANSWTLHVPVEETLAEIAAMRAAGRVVGTARYQELMARVEAAYQRSILQATRKSRVAAKRQRATPGELDFFDDHARGKKAESVLNARFQKAPKLTAAQKQALEDYQGDYYEEVNGWLRGRGSRQDASAALRATVQKITEEMNKAMARMPALDAPVLVYRGAGRNAAFLKDGTVFVDKGFASTSTRLSIAQTFAKLYQNKSNVLLRISLPKGTRGMWMKSAIKDGTEGEFLLASSTKFRVLRVLRLTPDQYAREMRAIGQVVHPDTIKLLKRKRITITLADVEVVP